MRPLASSNPIRTTIALQRDAADDLDDESGDDAGLPSPWWGSAADSPAAPGLSAISGMSGPSAPIQRLAADGAPARHPASSMGDARPAAQRAVAAASQARVQRISGPSARSSLPELILPRDTAHRASGSAAAAEATTQSISFPTRAPAGGSVVQTSPAPASASFTGQLPGEGGAGVAVQRDGTVPVAGPAPATPVGPAGSTAPGGSSGHNSSGASAHSERDLDELAQALFGRIRTRIRSDLIHDREAKGLTFDNI